MEPPLPGLARPTAAGVPHAAADMPTPEAIGRIAARFIAEAQGISRDGAVPAATPATAATIAARQPVPVTLPAAPVGGLSPGGPVGGLAQVGSLGPPDQRVLPRHDGIDVATRLGADSKVMATDAALPHGFPDTAVTPVARTARDGGPVAARSLPGAAVATVDRAGLRAFIRGIRRLDHLAVPGLDLRLPAEPAGPASAALPFDVARVRRDFPILHQTVNGHPLAWLDNAATTQKPQAVIDALTRFYSTDNSNIHRGAHALAARATDAHEAARATTARFLGASRAEEILFVRGCTEGINLVANIVAPRLRHGDEIVLLELEHHANIVPWQMVAERTGAVIRVAPIDDRGDVIVEAYERLLGPRTRLVAMSHASNSLGTIVPVELLTALAKARGALVLVDGAQSVAHFPVDVRRIGCDFFVFSGHKIFGPTGIGAVYAAADLLPALPPWQGGGNMIRDVRFERTEYADPPARFEAGTPNIADAVGLAAALDYVSALGRERIAAYEHALLAHATRRLEGIDGLRLVGTSREKVGVLSFVLAGHDPVAVGQRLDKAGIAVRAGHHCAQPSLRHFGLEATVRPSLAFYNTPAEVDRLAEVVAGLGAG